VNLEWRHISLTVPANKKERKTILDDVSGTLTVGSITGEG
jgi:hypothetical protein